MESRKRWKAVPNRRKGTWIVNCLTRNQKPTTRTLGKLTDLTPARAQRLADRAQDEEETGEWTVSEVIRRFENFKQSTLRDISMDNYRYFNRLIEEKFGPLPLYEILSGVVEEWLIPLDMAPGTKGQIKQALGRLWKYAAKRGMVPEVDANPMQWVDIPNVSRLVRPTEPMTREQFWAFLDALERPFSIIALVSLAHSLRIGEARAFKWMDYDPFEGTLQVERDIVEGKVNDCKTEESKKLLRLAPRMIQELEAWRKESHYTRPGDWIFASPYTDGEKPYDHKSVVRHYQRAAKMTGLKRANTHIMRHTHAFWADEYLGAHPEAQRQSMRHKRKATTELYGRERKKKRLSPAAEKLQHDLTEMAFGGIDKKPISSDFRVQ